MNWLQRAWRRAMKATASRAMKYAGIPLRDPALVALFGRRESASGQDVTEDTALNFSAVYSAVNLIASTVGMLPLRLVEKGGGDGDLSAHLAHRLVSQCPNDYATPLTFFRTHMAHILTHGNAYVEIVRAGSAPVSLRTLVPDAVNPRWTDDGELEYELRGESRVLQPADVIHVPGLGYDGTIGYSPIDRAREGVGLGLATEQYGAGFFGNGAVPLGVLTHPGDLSPEGEENLAKSWNDRHRNRDGGNRTAVLDEGMKYQMVGIPPEDAQFLATRSFQVVEIARWYRVPPHMLYEAIQATFANMEQQNLDFLTYTLLPWLTAWQQELARKLLTVEEQERYEFVHDVSRFLMADTPTRYASHSAGLNAGFLSLNDVRRKESMPLLDASIGDVYRSPSTMKVLGSADPTAPIDPAVMQAAIDVVTKLRPDAATARGVLSAAMPTATDTFLDSLVKTLQTSKVLAA